MKRWELTGEPTQELEEGITVEYAQTVLSWFVTIDGYPYRICSGMEQNTSKGVLRVGNYNREFMRQEDVIGVILTIQ